MSSAGRQRWQGVSPRHAWQAAWAMARRMIRRRRRGLACVAALWFAQHAERRGLPRWAIELACRLATNPPASAAVGTRAELARMFGGRATLEPVSPRHPDLFVARHDDPLARVHLRRADRAWRAQRRGAVKLPCVDQR